MQAQQAKGCIIAAPHSGAGKTLVTLGLLAAFRRENFKVSAAKVGPDYIDPSFHLAASGKPSVNLDLWAMGPNLVTHLAHQAAAGESLLIEGVMGLFDGADNGVGSTADVAAHLHLPVLLVVNARSQAHSAAALLHGFKTYRKDINLAGVLFNHVQSERHAKLLQEAAEKAGTEALGFLPSAPSLEMPSRHLGLVQANEHKSLETLLAKAAHWISENTEISRLYNIFQPLREPSKTSSFLPPIGQRIAIAKDKAFGFSYTHLMASWQDAGAELVPFSPLDDEAPIADADAVFLPGGYPELYASRLAENHHFLDGLRRSADTAMIYGECGGFMVLGERLIDSEGTSHAMAGLLPISTSFAERKRHLGYRTLVHESPLPWPKTLRGHEFHYSSLVENRAENSLFKAHQSTGDFLGEIGAYQDRVLGSYAHVIAPSAEDHP